MGKGPEETFFQRRHPNGQQVHRKVLNIIHHQENANENHSDPSDSEDLMYPKYK